MPNFRRYYIPHAIIFITCVTNHRYPYLESSKSVDLFFHTVERVQDIYNFDLLAFVVLPDHFHWLMEIGDPSGDFSKVMHSIKRNYTINYKKVHNLEMPLSIWQKRFWDHIIRDEEDMEHHVDYVHWNPVKHGYTRKPEEWVYSSYEKWLDKGYYERGWGWMEEPAGIRGMEIE